MNETGQNLTKNQLKAIPIILQAKSIIEGTKKAGISKTTFYEWLKIPEFKAEFVHQRQEIIDIALHELKTSANDAVSVMRGLLTARNENIRLRAAFAILEHISKFTEFEKLEERIQNIERSIQK